MDLNKRASLGLSTLLSVLLAGIVVRDVYVDWALQEKSLVSTLLENIAPLVLAVGVFAVAYRIYATRDREFMQTLTQWQYAGAIGIFVIALEVVGLQLVQGELKPRLIIIQMTIGGAIAGTLVGFATARQRQSKQQVRAERDKFEALFDNAPAQSVEVSHSDGTVTIEDTNDAFDAMFCTGDATPVGDPLFEVIAHDEQHRDAIRNAISTDEQYETKLETATVDGRKNFQVRVVPFGSEERAYLLYTDVTELKTIQHELEETVDRLEASNDRLQQFAYIASHDLQEPARMVSSYVSLLDEEYGDQFDEEAREYMHFARDGANRMQDMIDGLLDYSRVRTQGEEFTETDAETVVSETLKDLELLVDEEDATVTSDDLPAVEADRTQLGQVFQNLFENALEHGGTQIHVGAERDGDNVVFSVADDGEGIRESQQDRIFELFEQGDRDNPGTGIGLAISDRIVSRHGGEMWVESEHGEGTTFYFTMPAAGA